MNFTYYYRAVLLLCAWNFYPFGDAICSDCCSCTVDSGVCLGFYVVDAPITCFVALNPRCLVIGSDLPMCGIAVKMNFKCGHVQSAGCRLFPHLKSVW